MISAKKIASHYLDGGLALPHAMAHLRAVPSTERQDFMREILFTKSLLLPSQSLYEGLARSFDRGSNALVEIFAGNTTATAKEVSQLVNDVQAIIFWDDLKRQPRGELSDVRTQGLVQIYLSLQSKSPAAALALLTQGASEPRTGRIFNVLSKYIDKPLIIDAAIESKKADRLYKASGWDDCLPYLSPKKRDAYIGRDLGL
ncbi:hypothetical protein IFT48_02655 [Pseudomonas fluorescens]|uniref:hypothetical protein n=1 Tax=Pseudomonas TaxID=286 RepID=UPI000F01CCD0|nr:MULTISPECIES: hypothetical protein [Pseudomonas]MBD8088866.1 hypothetical protein [Pseudomonas fluorescens]